MSETAAGEKYFYTRSLNGVQLFPGTNVRQITCNDEQDARSCAVYHSLTYGGEVMRGGRDAER